MTRGPLAEVNRPLTRQRRTGAGQMLVVMALSMVAIVSMMGLLLDGGSAWAAQRSAQAAADTAALAAGQAATDGSSMCVTDNCSAAVAIAAANGFPKDFVDCAGVTHANEGVKVNRPPTTGPHTGDTSFIQVVAKRTTMTTVAAVIGLNCMVVSGRAVVSVASSAVASCNFCVLTKWAGDGSDNPFMMDNGGDLRVDGDILVNGPAINGATCTPTGAFSVCGKAMHLYHSGGATTTYLSAHSIALAGGWESAGGTQAKAEVLATVGGTACQYHPDPNGYAPSGFPTAKVCIGMTPINDPLNDAANPGNIITPPDPATMDVPKVGVNGCPTLAQDPGVRVPTGLGGLGISSAGNYTICPGLYFGGFGAFEHFGPKIKMLPGTYYMVGGGFTISGRASVNGNGVMIYSAGLTSAFQYSTPQGNLTELTPPCAAPSPCRPVTTTLTASPSGAIAMTQSVVYTLRVQVGSGSPITGTVTFYDGSDPIAGCQDLALTPGLNITAPCTQSYDLYGTRWITAVYNGDTNYAGSGKQLSKVINPPAGLTADNVVIKNDNSSSASCNPDCGRVILKAPSSGTYAGLLIFQDRDSAVGVTLWPAAGLGGCPANFMTDGVSPNTNPVPAPCGALGGLQGTIYAPHARTGTGWDAAIDIRADGLANVQVIAARISLAYNTNVRFAYRPEVFANGQVHLVE